MDAKKLEYFKNKLLKAKNQILNGGVLTNLEDIKIPQEGYGDDADHANNTINQHVSFSIREREMHKLNRIEAALLRIEEGVYGICIESGEEIEEKRLENQPWAEYTIEVAEDKEREQSQIYRRA